jgi:N-acetyl-alpha-D-glucosaminyl L-malate synthase BshA
VIPNFVDPEVFRRGREPCHRATLAPGGEKIIMHISNFRAVKRIPDVVEIFARIASKVPARLVLVGDGPERPRAVERAEELGVIEQVLFLGKHASVDELLSCADLFLLPSKNESFGLAALEALSCGVPVIASNMGGLPEVVTHGETGYLFPLGSVEEMAEAGSELLLDSAHWARVSEAARRSAVERFSNDSVVPMYEQLYQDVLEGSPGG